MRKNAIGIVSTSGPHTPTCTLTAIQVDYLNQTSHRGDLEKFLQEYRPDAAAGNAAQDFEIHNIADASDYQGAYKTAKSKALNYEGNLDAAMVLGVSWPTPFTVYDVGG